MGLTVKNKNNYELSDDINNFFSLPIDEPKSNSINYDDLKVSIYGANLDNEEKANIINKINNLKIVKNDKERNKLLKEIEEFKYFHNL